MAESETSTWADNLLQNGATITLNANESILLLLRVVGVDDDVNLAPDADTVEPWNPGDTSLAIGSDVPSDKYMDASGNSPSTSDARIPNKAVVLVYDPRVLP